MKRQGGLRRTADMGAHVFLKWLPLPVKTVQLSRGSNGVLRYRVEQRRTVLSQTSTSVHGLVLDSGMTAWCETLQQSPLGVLSQTNPLPSKHTTHPSEANAKQEKKRDRQEQNQNTSTTPDVPLPPHAAPPPPPSLLVAHPAYPKNTRHRRHPVISSRSHENSLQIPSKFLDTRTYNAHLSALVREGSLQQRRRRRCLFGGVGVDLAPQEEVVPALHRPRRGEAVRKGPVHLDLDGAMVRTCVCVCVLRSCL